MQLGAKASIYYLEQSLMQQHANITLVSIEGENILVEKLILVSMSKLLYSLLLDQEYCCENILIHTQVTKHALSVFYQFVTTGTLPKGSWNNDILSSFKSLGVDLESLLHPKELDTREDLQVKVEVLEEDFVEGTRKRKSECTKKVKVGFRDDQSDTEFIAKAQDYDSDDADFQDADSDLEDEPISKSRRKHKKNRALYGSSMEPRLECDWCDEKKKYCEVDLEAHKMICHSDKASQCQRCKKIILLQNKKSVEKHNRDQCADRLVFQCVCCGVRALRKNIFLNKHIKEFGAKHCTEPYQCPLCPPGTEFTTYPEHYKHCSDFHDGIIVLPCPTCNEVFGSKGQLSDHISIDHIDDENKFILVSRSRDLFKPFQCKKCCLGFLTKEAADHHEARHRLRETKNLGDLLLSYCRACDKMFACTQEVEKHIEEEHKVDLNQKCHICHAEVKGKKGLSQHIANHHHVKPLPVKENIVCICCGDIFDAKKKYRTHMRRLGEFHNNKCAYKECPDVSFVSWPEHVKHVKEVHDSQFVTRCRLCPEYFKNEYLLSLHKKEVHDGRQVKLTDNQKLKVMCPQCGMVIIKADLHKHLESKHANDMVQCDICSKMMKKISLRHHRRSHDQSHICPHCGKAFSKHRLKHHIRAQHTANNQMPVHCQECNKGFVNQKSLEWHMNIHTGEKPFKCEVCGAAFAHPANQKAHMKAHQGIKRIKN